MYKAFQLILKDGFNRFCLDLNGKVLSSSGLLGSVSSPRSCQGGKAKEMAECRRHAAGMSAACSRRHVCGGS